MAESCSPPTASTPQSEVVRELRRLPVRVQRALGVEDWMLEILDACIQATFVLTDAADTRSLEERIDSIRLLFPAGSPEMSPELARLLDELPETVENLTAEQLPRWAKRMGEDGHWRRFARKLLGAKAYDRLSRAVRTDTRIIMQGLRGLIERGQPYAAAFDDLVSVLTIDQIRKLENLPGGVIASALRLVVALDSVLEDWIASEFDWTVWNAFGERIDDSFDVSAVLDHLRPLISEPLQAELADLNERLVRKLRGAKTALETSDDGVSQAANSLIELIDRLLRTAFTDTEVLAWLTATGRTAEIRCDDTGQTRPTKKGQALCFIYGAVESEQPSGAHEAAAVAIVSVRNGLQKLKHADTGADTERDEMLKYLLSLIHISEPTRPY